MRLINSSLLLLTLVFLNACKTDCIKPGDEIITRNIVLENFEAFESNMPIDVTIVPSDRNELQVEMASNLLPYINKSVDGGTYKFGFGDQSVCFNNKDVKATLHVLSLKKLTVNGSGDIDATGAIHSKDFTIELSGSGDIKIPMSVEKLEVTLSGAGDIELSGTAVQQKLRLSGAGDIDSGELTGETVEAEIKGSGDITTHPTKKLDAKISGAGNIYYVTKPAKMDIQISGAGEVKSND